MMCGVAPAFAQVEGEASATKKEVSAKPRKQYPTRVIKGRVVNAATNNPVSGAMVRVAEVEGYSALTRSDGTYELKVPLFASSLTVSYTHLDVYKRQV